MKSGRNGRDQESSTSPRRWNPVLITMGEARRDSLPYARMLFRNGYKIFAAQHNAEEFQVDGINRKIVNKVSEKTKSNILDYLTSKEIKLVINISAHQGDARSQNILRDEYLIRRKAAECWYPGCHQP